MTKPIRVALVGAKGRMGRTIVDLAKENPNIEIVAQCDLGDTIEWAAANSNLMIDFSNAGAIDEICRAIDQHPQALVIGTTGHSPEQGKNIEAAAKAVPIVFASNFSVGVNVLFALTRKAGGLLGNEFEQRIVETHHTKKKDAPSGTAKTLAQILKEGRKSAVEIPIESIREGDVVGEHTVFFTAPGERVELTHRAFDRGIFARGALRAAEWIIDKQPGLYSMQDVLGL
jgi:4-hydroxy-tetrahydrodipicolinate reductase